MKPYGPKHEKQQRRQKDLLKRLLEHLQLHGKSNKEGLHVVLDLHRTGDVSPTMHDAIQSGLVMVVGHDLQLTESGSDRLKDAAYWH